MPTKCKCGGEIGFAFSSCTCPKDSDTSGLPNNVVLIIDDIAWKTKQDREAVIVALRDIAKTITLSFEDLARAVQLITPCPKIDIKEITALSERLNELKIPEKERPCRPYDKFRPKPIGRQKRK